MRHSTHPTDLAAQSAQENARFVRANHDRGLAFDLATMNRRQMLGLSGGAALVAAGSLVTGANAATDTVIPSETAGPYPADGSNGVDVRVEDGIVRSDITSSFGDYSGTVEGVPVTIDLDLWDVDSDAALAGVAVYLWHATPDGEYSLYSHAIAEENFLRGIQESDENGHVSFTSIFPGCYDGRWPHIHFEVYSSLEDATSGSGTPIKTSQIAVPEEIAWRRGWIEHPGRASTASRSAFGPSQTRVRSLIWKPSDRRRSIASLWVPASGSDTSPQA